MPRKYTKRPIKATAPIKTASVPAKAAPVTKPIVASKPVEAKPIAAKTVEAVKPVPVAVSAPAATIAKPAPAPVVPTAAPVPAAAPTPKAETPTAPVVAKPAPVVVPEPVVAQPAPVVAKAAPAPVATAKPKIAAPVTPVIAKTINRSKPTANTVKGMFEMATAAVTPEKIQSLFTEFNDRTKAAFEKSTKLGEEFAGLTKGNLEAVAESAKIAAKGAESIAQEAADYTKRSFETATSTLKRYSAVKSPAELIQLNSEFAKTSFDSAVAEASKISEALTKLAGDFFQPLSTRYAVAAEKLKTTAL